jgi:flagellar hook-associated protein 2
VGTITSGIGIVSGIDYQSMIDQLMAIDARPRDRLMTRIGGINAQKTAYLDISARITALLSRINVLTRTASFQVAKAVSSKPDLLSVTAGAGAQPGAYSFVVRALASTHQFVSGGFQDRTSPLQAGTLTIESARAQVNSRTQLDELNGHTGVHRGSFKISNGSQEAVINISDAFTVGDVVERINAAGIQVSASVSGDGLVLKDLSGTGSVLRVQEVGTGKTAADLGFGTGFSYSTTGELAGDAAIYLAASTPVSALNDGLGLRTALAGGDFTIDAGGKSISVNLSDILSTTTRLGRLNHGQGVRLGTIRVTSKDGTTATLDLSGATDINGVKQAIEGAFGGGRLSVVVSGSRLIINDNTDVTKLTDDQKSDFIIEDVTGYAARDLGFDGRSSKGKISGRDVLHMDTLGDVIGAVTYAVNNEDDAHAPLVTAAIAADGHGLELRTAGGPMVLTGPGAGARSKALFDLGLQEGTYEDTGGGAVAAGSRIVGSLDTVLLKTLNGGAGVTGSTIQIAANGKNATIDVTDCQTLAEVMDRINQATDAGGGGSLGVEATYDATGTHLVLNNLVDSSALTVSGDFAEGLGLAQTGVSIKSANLQRRYISEATRLADMNSGRGVALAGIKITNSKGVYATLNLAAASAGTLQDVIDEINRLNIGVQAGINATGDGLLLTDTAGGTGTMKVEEDGGTTARDLNILGTAQNGQIDGSYEFKLQIGGSDTLEGLAARIGAETTLATATLLNDGTQLAPYRLTVSAGTSGAAGALLIDDSTTNLGMSMLAPAQDARVFFGGSSASGVLLTSATNTFSDVVQGLTFTANGVDDQPVTVNVDRDVESLVTALQGLVDDYNSAVDRVNEVGAYDAENQTPGILQGEGTLYTIESRLSRLFTGAVYAPGAFHRLSDVGIQSESGGHFTFDADKFRAAYESNPAGMERFFTDSQYGVAVQIQKQIEQLTDADGLIPQETATLTDNTDLLQERVTQMNEELDRKRARLLRDFQAMEASLAQLQSQQGALSNLAAMAQTYTTSSTSTSK